MKQTEHLNQVALIQWWYFQHKKFKLPEYALFAIPNGGHRNILTAVKLKREGVRSGISDLMLAVPNNTFSGLFIEMKAGKNKASINQNEFLSYALSVGYQCVVCWKWEDAKVEILKYLKDL